MINSSAKLRRNFIANSGSKINEGEMFYHRTLCETLQFKYA